jgi:Alpha/beta hydrolase family
MSAMPDASKIRRAWDLVPAYPPLQFAPVSLGKLSYRSDGAGRALVFLHGLLGNSQSWAFQYQHFARTHRVIAWDAPGFGQSDMVEPSLDAYVSALRDFLDTFGEQPIDLVGHSMGGTVASEAEVGFLCDWILARLLPHHATIAVPLSIIPGSRATARYSERGRDGWPPLRAGADVASLLHGTSRVRWPSCGYSTQ